MNSPVLRSVLYMPASNQRAMDKARSLPADAIIFDLEDAVSPDAKESAREKVLAQLAVGGYGARQLIVRANALSTPWGEADIRALAKSGIATICLPKIETLEQLALVHALLVECGRADVRLWAMIETPLGVSNVDHLAQFDTLTALVMGTTDLAAELRVPHRPDRLGLQYSLGRCILAARRSGITIVDGVHLELDDPDGLNAICEQGRALGFDGKTLIHPKQIDSANRTYGYSDEELEHARKILQAWDSAQAQGKGVAVLDGKLVEVMHVDEATRMLKQAQRLLELESTS
jgi:citrate lyase subunit beta/citryl-CoA lyase